ncbi:MAG: S8 family serine peptidase, partial [Actinobacteria bacterium]|nr:S8 family serine peptidase [Actinomycetota bacterium]
LPAGPAGSSPRPAAPAPSEAGAEAGQLGTGVTGTGPLETFTAPGSNLIRLLAGAFDPLADPLLDPGTIALVDVAALPAGTAQYWLVQVKDRRFPEATAAIEATGGLIAGYVHDDTYMVRATPVQRLAIDTSDAVRWTGFYQPAWRIPVAAGGRQGLLDLEGEQVYRVHAFRDDPEPEAVGEALAGMPGVEVVVDAGVVVDVVATASEAPAIAAIPAVEWVGIAPNAVLLNANSRWVNDTGVRDLFAATAPGRLTGAGQTAGVADTGVNYTYDVNGRAHVGFRDCNPDGTGCKEAIYTMANPGSVATADLLNVVDNATGHRKVVAYFDLGGTGPNPYDPSSHGSHTGGSVTGDQPPYGEYTGHDGLAPGANHVHQNIGTASGGLRLPSDDYQLWRQAYRPRNPGSVPTSSPATGNVADYANYLALEDARTHNNSYGLIVPVIDEGSAVALDRFVWDHEDMVVVVSAGNGGPGPGSIGTPSVAKNNLSSGASANGRQPMASIDSMASFSSHGPTADGRFGPDLATPGQVVVSVKGGSEDEYHVAQGTSMSGPVLTGLATLVRQYFWDGYGPKNGKGFARGAASTTRKWNPSAALVKAALVNGAVRMRGWYTGDDGTTRVEDGQWPSAGQGFGLVNLDNSLFFENDPLGNWYHDAWRADPDAFPVSAAPATRTYQLSVEAGKPFDVTLAWTDAPDLLPAGSPALVNDLNLTVTDPNGVVYVGNNMNSRATPAVQTAETLPGAAPPDTVNLTERVRVTDPVAGTWTITVTARPVARGNQGFALAASGLLAPPGKSFRPGPELQTDQPGSPTIGDVSIEPASADTIELRFSTSEPTTARATVTIAGTSYTFADSHNEGMDGFPRLDEGTVETSGEYADKPVVGTDHEILITGLEPGETYAIAIAVEDLATNQAAAVVNHVTTSLAYQADADDIGQLDEGAAGGWRTGTQLYAGDFGGDGLLGAFMFRIPEGKVDPAEVVGAAVEVTSAHDWVVPYTTDPIVYVDLLDESVESDWGTQTYQQIHGAGSDARLNAETTHLIGGYRRYSFALPCGGREALQASMA